MPSQKARDDLKGKLSTLGVTDKEIKEPSIVYPSISVVGIPSSYDKDCKDELKETLLRQNPRLQNLLNQGTETVFEILVIKPVKNNPSQTLIRQS